MDIRIIKDKGLSQQAKTAIQDYIRSLDGTASLKLPREEELAKKLGVSRITVRTALHELAAEGLLFRRQGKGTFINREALQVKALFNPIDDIRKLIVQSGYSVCAETLHTEIRLPTSEEAQKLQIGPQKPILIIERLFRADGHPAVYCIDRIPEAFFSKDPQHQEAERSIYDFFQVDLGRKIAWDRVEISAIPSETHPQLKAHFAPQQPKAFLDCDIVNFDEDDTPVFYANEYYDTDYIRFNLIRQKKFS